ncbi:MAG: hypothetical protein OXR68_03075 [Alphaproteobacteria bacterium]|nr:hypothetical protein [Alphaproteobacteria bacterium]MDD9919587.1 hypothetical protein [Alphaproteobacteria bacterium]
MKNSLLLILLFTCFIYAANAVCSNPAGEEGEQIYNLDHKVMQYCDGTNWQAMGAIQSNIQGYERITNNCGSTTTCTVSCSAGKEVLGGGCVLDAPGSGSVYRTYPPSNSAWECTTTGTIVITAYAICAEIQ